MYEESFISDASITCSDQKFVYDLRNIKSVSRSKLAQFGKGETIIFTGKIEFPEKSDGCSSFSWTRRNMLRFNVQLDPNAVRRERDASY